jgi:hypothetical protein
MKARLRFTCKLKQGVIEPRGEGLMEDKEGSESKLRGKMKNESVTFRVNSEILRLLKKEANDKDISPSTLVNQLIKSHVGWHSVAPKAGFIPVRRVLITKLFEGLDEQEIRSTAQHVAKVSNREMLLHLRTRISIEAALNFFESWLRASNFGYRYQGTQNFRHFYVVQHNMGRKWSLYVGELYKYLFEECKAKKFEYYAREDTLLVTIEAD